MNEQEKDLNKIIIGSYKLGKEVKQLKLFEATEKCRMCKGN